MLDSQRVSSPLNPIESSESPQSQPPILESPNENLTPNGTVTGTLIIIGRDKKIWVTVDVVILKALSEWVAGYIPGFYSMLDETIGYGPGFSIWS